LPGWWKRFGRLVWGGRQLMGQLGDQDGDRRLQYAAALENLVGKTITRAWHAATLRGFAFGGFDNDEKAPWSFHIQCSWRIETQNAIITGSEDWFERANPELADDDDWDPGNGGSLQEARLRELFRDPDSCGAIANNSALLTCTSFEVDALGSVVIGLTGGFMLRVFPAGSRGEHWRIFLKGDDESHVVCKSS